MNTLATTTTNTATLAGRGKALLGSVLKRWVRIEAIYMVLIAALLFSPEAFAGSSDLVGALNSLLDKLQLAGAAIIGLAIFKWGIDFLQGGGATREAFTTIGIGAGLILGAKALGASI